MVVELHGQIPAYHYAGYGEVTTHPITEGHHVRLHAGVLDRPYLPGAAGAGLHLVGYEQSTVLVAGGLNRLDEL